MLNAVLHRHLLPLLLAAATTQACVTAPGPGDVANAYATALEQGRTEDAWTHVSPDQKKAGLTREAFRARYQSAEVRTARARAVRDAAAHLTAKSGDLTLIKTGDTWTVVEPAGGEAGARKALMAFIAAAEGGDFQAAWALLSEDLRARYTPELLERDFRAEPLSKERLARARAAAAGEPVVEGDGARFPIGAGKAVRLRLEPGGYRVVALE